MAALRYGLVRTSPVTLSRRTIFAMAHSLASARASAPGGLSSVAASRRAGEEQSLPGVGEVVLELLG